MAWEELKALSRKTGRGVATGVRFARYHETKSNNRSLVWLRLGEDVMKEAGWVIGDRIKILIDRSDMRVLLRRNKEGRWSLCPSGRRVSDDLGKSKTAVIRMALEPALEGVVFQNGTDVVLMKHSVTPDGVMLLH